MACVWPIGFLILALYVLIKQITDGEFYDYLVREALAGDYPSSRSSVTRPLPPHWQYQPVLIPATLPMHWIRSALAIVLCWKIDQHDETPAVFLTLIREGKLISDNCQRRQMHPFPLSYYLKPIADQIAFITVRFFCNLFKHGHLMLSVGWHSVRYEDN